MLVGNSRQIDRMLTSLPELLSQPLVQALIVCAGVYGAIRADIKNIHATQARHTKDISTANKRIDNVILTQLHRSPHHTKLTE